ncbi:MAG: hypothetical protein H0U03_14480 [Actinobacteria bacterium]|nr:hypothetical protein [Actinomycetota bacterium]
MTRILVVEHDSTVRELIHVQLRVLGYSPVEPEAGEDFDLALIEPELREGLELARRLRRERPSLPIVFMSVREPTERTESLEPRAHLVKPVGLAALHQRLEGVLAGATRAAASADSSSYIENGFKR